MKSIKRAIIGLMALTLSLTTVAVTAFSEHITLDTARPRDFFSYVDAGTLVIIELEDVLMRTNEDLGSEQWADFLVRKLCFQGYSPSVARAEITPLWNRVLTQSTVDSVEPLVQGAVRTLQRNGCVCMGLTLKDSEASDAVLRLLDNVDVDFRYSGPREGVFIVASDAPAKLIDGVLFSGVYNQPGITLLHFFEQAGFWPNKVVLISGKADLLQAVGGAMQGRGVPFVGIRYGGNDAHAAAFRSEIAEIQLNFFEEILSNEAADLLRPRSSFWPF